MRFKIVDATTSSQPYRDGTTLDLARGGLRFETTERLQVGDCLALHLTLPGSGQVVAVLADVRRLRALRGGQAHEVGVSFLWSGWHDNEMQRALAAFVRDSAAGE